MRGQKRTPSTLQIQLLDFTPINTNALAFVNAQEEEQGQPKSTDCKPMNSYGFIETEDGAYVICSEGVGNSRPISVEEPYELHFYTERVDEDNKRYIGIIPSCNVPIKSADMLYGYATGETTPLHNFIRTFGDRLETNY